MFKEPLGVFTNLADFGETVQIGGVEVPAVFDREYAPDGAYGFAVGNADPRLIVAESSLPENTKSAVINVRGVEYTVAEIALDGTGIAVIQLRSKQHETPTY
ncbi:head-tail joining protein [Neisseria dentiae]|uniref:head-tail joining protein n=1 Tax=Neisseria dentiae TaxID=194197 RepID=UPI00211BC47E|nr:hypothetical protein [Neisseria dentiae]MCQ9325523.1 hypothetical protein [Neisseria dentiae]